MRSTVANMRSGAKKISFVRTSYDNRGRFIWYGNQHGALDFHSAQRLFSQK